MITTVAGSAGVGTAGDGGPATSAQLMSPAGVAVTADGGFVVTDVQLGAVRLVEGNPPDSTPPDTTILQGPAEGSVVAATGATFTYSGSPVADVHHLECRLDAAAFAMCAAAGTSHAALAEGVHRFAVRAVDSAGNVDPTPASRTWSVDTTAPVITLVTPAAGGVYRLAASGLLAALLPPTRAVYECSDGTGSGVASCTGTVPNGSPIDTRSLGSKSFTVTARDAAGNASTRTASYRVVILGCLPDPAAVCL